MCVDGRVGALCWRLKWACVRRAHSKCSSDAPQSELDLVTDLHYRIKFARSLSQFFHHFRSLCLTPFDSQSRESDEAQRNLRAAIAALRDVEASVA